MDMPAASRTEAGRSYRNWFSLRLEYAALGRSANNQGHFGKRTRQPKAPPTFTKGWRTGPSILTDSQDPDIP
jgi:hypothetical protein